MILFDPCKSTNFQTMGICYDICELFLVFFLFRGVVVCMLATTLAFGEPVKGHKTPISPGSMADNPLKKYIYLPIFSMNFLPWVSHFSVQYNLVD